MSFPVWKGLFEWSMKYQDGTSAPNRDVKPMSKQDAEWLEQALKQYMIDFAARMKEIKAALDKGEEDEKSLTEKECMLEELMDIVCSIDFARDLHKVGGLPTLLDLLSCPHPSLRWRAAEVVATCVQNNPPVQQWFMEGGALPRIMQLMEDAHCATCRVKACLALSGMCRHFGHGLEAARQAGAVRRLVQCVHHEDVRLQKKAITLLHYFFTRHRADACEAASQGLHSRCRELLDSSESESRQAALCALVDLAEAPGAWQQVKELQGLGQKLQQLAAAHAQLPKEDQDAQAEELELLTRLQALVSVSSPPPQPADINDDILSHESSKPQAMAVNEAPQPALNLALGMCHAASDKH